MNKGEQERTGVGIVLSKTPKRYIDTEVKIERCVEISKHFKDQQESRKKKEGVQKSVNILCIWESQVGCDEMEEEKEGSLRL